MEKTSGDNHYNPTNDMAEAQNAGAPNGKPSTLCCGPTIDPYPTNDMAEAQNAGARRDYSRNPPPH